MVTNLYKYPRTFHLPWSKGKGKNDRTQNNLSHLEDKEIVVTLKMDGENSTLYPDYFHARSLDSTSHPSQSWLKNYHQKIKHLIPNEWRVCGENLFAVHSIPYHNLESYFYLFSIWNEENYCLSWDATQKWAENLLKVPTPKVLYRGPFDIKALKALQIDEAKDEGYVVRISDGFHYSDFNKYVSKYVREKHVQTDEHWKSKPIIPNKLK